MTLIPSSLIDKIKKINQYIEPFAKQSINTAEDFEKSKNEVKKIFEYGEKEGRAQTIELIYLFLNGNEKTRQNIIKVIQKWL